MRDYKEIFDELMQRSKEELAALLTINEMLKEEEKQWKTFTPNIIESQPFSGMACRTWDDCTNPHMDCTNCPLRNRPNKYTINNKGTFSSTTYKEGDGQFAGIDQYQFTC